MTGPEDTAGATTKIADNPARSRYELIRDGEVVSVLLYERQADHLVVPHVETHPDHRGNDYAATLVLGVLDRLRRDGLKVRPLCGFAARTIHEHPDYEDLLI